MKKCTTIFEMKINDRYILKYTIYELKYSINDLGYDPSMMKLLSGFGKIVDFQWSLAFNDRRLAIWVIFFEEFVLFLMWNRKFSMALWNILNSNVNFRYHYFIRREDKFVNPERMSRLLFLSSSFVKAQFKIWQITSINMTEQQNHCNTLDHRNQKLSRL